jgi:hypothetical protein
MGHLCPVHGIVHGEEAYLLHEALTLLAERFHRIRVPNCYLIPTLEDIPTTDSSLALPTPPGRNSDECLWGHVCLRHDVVHGQEALLVRNRINQLMNLTDKTGGVIDYWIRGIYRDTVVPADTLAWITENWGK